MSTLKKVFVLLLCIFLLAGCGHRDEAPTVSKIAEDLIALSSDDITWVEISSAKISSYFGFDSEKVEDFKGYINDSEENYDIIAVFDTENRNDVITGINLLVADRENTYKVASENVFSKISQKVIAEKDDIIILCITDNYSKTRKYISEELDAKIIS